MSHYATSLLYVSLGGEMLYVLQQRLQAQNISADKTIQVLNDIIYSLINTKQLQFIFFNKTPMGVYLLRPVLERVILSSIMKLSADSMNKLFDLMIAMTKFQLKVSTGPREVVLSMLNHLDTIRDMTSCPSLVEHIETAHQLIINTFGNLTHGEIWEIRQICVRELQDYNVKVSILLRFGYQNVDTTFNRPTQDYDENYEQRKKDIENVKLLDSNVDTSIFGTLEYSGDRVTMLGKNILQKTFKLNEDNVIAVGNKSTCQHRRKSVTKIAAISSNSEMKRELETLATELGVEETVMYKRPFSLHLFSDDDDDNAGKSHTNRQTESVDSNDGDTENKNKNDSTINDDLACNTEYKKKLLGNVNVDFDQIEASGIEKSVDFMNLLDTN